VTGNGITLYLAKYSSSGALSWVQTGVAQYAAQNNPVGLGMAVNAAAGTVYITGYAQNDTTFSSANGTVNTVSGVGSWHMILAKYDTSGNFRWGETNAAEPNSIAYAVAVDASDNAQEFFLKRGYVGKQRNTVTVNGEWLANTTMQKTLVAAPGGPA